MSFSKPKRQHTDRTLKEKLDILHKLDCGIKGVNICKEFNLSPSTFLRIKNRSIIKGVTSKNMFLYDFYDFYGPVVT